MERGDKRILNESLTVRTAISIGTIPAGEVIVIQQVDVAGRQVLVEDVWMHAATIERISTGVSASDR